MSVLLDTHVWIWSQERPDELGPETTRRLRDLDCALFVSTISTLEIARLAAVGTIATRGSLRAWLTETLATLQAKTIEITHDVATNAYDLPGLFHKDPADRILVATARLHAMTLVTADRKILAYEHVDTLDART